MARPGRPWERDEIRLLRELWDERASDEHIATVLGRSLRAIKVKRHKLRLTMYTRPTRPPRTLPTPERVAILRETIETIRLLARARADHEEIELLALDALVRDESVAPT